MNQIAIGGNCYIAMGDQSYQYTSIFEKLRLYISGDALLVSFRAFLCTKQGYITGLGLRDIS